MADLNHKQIEKLKSIVAASTNGTDKQYLLAPPKDVKALEDAGLIESNADIKGPFGAIAWRSTVYGVNYVEELPKDDAPAAIPMGDDSVSGGANETQPPAVFGDPNAAAAPPAVEDVPMPAAAQSTAMFTSDDFELEDDVPIPDVTKRKRGGARPDMYPFARMEIGQSFFVPATAARPKPWRTMASTVNTAMARYAKPAEDGSKKKNRDGLMVPVMVKTRVFLLVENEKAGVKGARIFRTG